MKIGLVCPYDYSFPGGVSNHISYLAHYFIQWGHEAKILAPSLKKDTHYFEEQVTAVGRPFPIPFGGSQARIPVSPWLPVQIGSILDREHFDILHLHEPFAPMLPISSLLKSNCINVGTFHAYYNKARVYWLGKPVFRRWLPRLHGKIAVSKPALQYVSRHLPGEYRIIPNGTNTDFFTPGGPIRQELADGKLNILFVGRMEKRKGLGYLISACAKMKRTFKDFRLIVVGPNTRLRRVYQKMAEDLELSDVVFTNFVPNSELPEYYRTADIFCAPATGGESFGIVLLEAMASGKPIVATDIEGYASVLSPGEEGLLVPPKDEKALANALVSLLKDGTARQQMGTKGRAKAEKYSWENIARQVMDYYNDLLQ
ncbi:MAG: glycosyltransferase family 4 protein [Chloroflexi bacterium]|nr:glycosyltransferase family 4 protein [Chloroflexota bacterium]MBM3182804.1 glycosyltransferase family 4 protein [Chloroflexota bacterium]MBM4451230.1 glycosyltransferase family 4 protein [Chloroflexota bacterium]MBM4453606.1 glycosyltransferase family 4 protein [Chloroflexota bacterium]